MQVRSLPGLTSASAQDDFCRCARQQWLRHTYLAVSEAERFKHTYVTVPELSAILGTDRPRDAVALSTKAGVKAACERPAFWKVLYRREEAVAAAKSIAATRSPASIGA